MRPGPKGRNPERTPSADARSALRATADLRPKSRLRRLASETRSADRSRGRSAPRPRLESASRTRPCGPDSLSGWPAAKSPATPAPPPVGLRPKSAAPGSRMSERAYSIPPAAAPRAQCLCRRVSGTVPEVRPGRHGRFYVARSAHGEAENCAASPRTHAERANARNGRCFPPCGRASPEAPPVRFRRLTGRGIAPAARRRAGCCTPAH